jgi:Enhancer of polycomb-like
VLSAASQRHSSSSRSFRGLSEKTTAKQQDAYIPIPDSAGLVEDYEPLHPRDRWRDPVSYVKTSETVEETTQGALANGFTYFMDERDKEWLDKNNEEARGEGTSAQGAVSGSGTTTRTSQRSAKAKGKEPDVALPIVISEDDFELVMGLFEKVTHEKTEFLHHVRYILSLSIERAKLIARLRVFSKALPSHHFLITRKHFPTSLLPTRLRLSWFHHPFLNHPSCFVLQRWCTLTGRSVELSEVVTELFLLST